MPAHENRPAGPGRPGPRRPAPPPRADGLNCVTKLVLAYTDALLAEGVRLLAVLALGALFRKRT